MLTSAFGNRPPDSPRAGSHLPLPPSTFEAGEYSYCRGDIRDSRGRGVRELPNPLSLPPSSLLSPLKCVHQPCPENFRFLFHCCCRCCWRSTSCGRVEVEGLVTCCQMLPRAVSNPLSHLCVKLWVIGLGFEVPVPSRCPSPLTISPSSYVAASPHFGCRLQASRSTLPSPISPLPSLLKMALFSPIACVSIYVYIHTYATTCIRI